MDPFFVSTTSVAVGELGDRTQLPSVILATRLLLQRESIDTGPLSQARGICGPRSITN